MLTANMLKWWYSAGWAIFTKEVFEKLSGLADFFSFGTIFRTFFSPFRQIDSGILADNASLSERFSAFVGRSISRLVGALVRLFIAIAGLIAIVLGAIIGFLVIGIWPFVPFFPLVGILLAIFGVKL